MASPSSQASPASTTPLPHTAAGAPVLVSSPDELPLASALPLLVASPVVLVVVAAPVVVTCVVTPVVIEPPLPLDPPDPLEVASPVDAALVDASSHPGPSHGLGTQPAAPSSAIAAPAQNRAWLMRPLIHRPGRLVSRPPARL